MDLFYHFLENLKENDKLAISAMQMALVESVYEEKPRDYGSGILLICPKHKSVLLALRGDSGEDPGVWCSFGGKGELGEIPVQTAMREVFEEAKFLPSMYKLHPEPIYVHQNSPDFKFITYLGIMDNKIDPIINDEHEDSKWVKIEELEGLNLHFGLTSLLNDEKCQKTINYYHT